jgi:SAM-dependent methyltransferase
VSVFSDYARYYNLLYGDKDYAAEADYADRLIQKFHPGARAILDLGCGTGRHDFILADKGYSVVGIDRSEQMLTEAKRQLSSLKSSIRKSLSFVHGDIRHVRLGRTFDAALALFHVISYQPTNSDLQQTFNTAAAHLEPNGVFIFDCWYGPGVLSDPPSVRTKNAEDGRVTVTRTAEPVLHPHKNLVDVFYNMFIKDKKTQKVTEVKECHRMRFLFKPEVEMFYQQCAFEPLAFMEFLKETSPKGDSWNVCFVARKAET